jgi:TolB protein
MSGLNMKMIRLSALMLLLAVSGLARAALTIDITQGVEGAVPIAIVPFQWNGAGGRPPEQMATIVSADLRRSGRFAPIAEQDLVASPHQAREVNYSNWRTLGVDHLVVGRMQQLSDQQFQVQFQLLDVLKGTQLTGYSFKAPRDALRRVGHQISDIIYEAITGERGAFDTNLAYVTVTKDRKGNNEYRLAVSDSDGYNERTVLKSPQPILSPSWSPDGRKLAYVSFSRNRPELYIQDLKTRSTQRVASFQGLNNAPAFSPDGQRLALTLSKDGNPEIYIMDLASRKLTRVTRSFAIDTEPAWMPDGSAIVFTSDRGGQPQLYRIAVNGQGATGRPERLTYEGNYNSRASISPDGKKIAMVHRGNGGGFRIAVLDLPTQTLSVLTQARLDESPSFAPNGRMIIYATQYNDRGVLAAVSVDGRAQQRLSLHQGNVREPAWSPFRQDR